MKATLFSSVICVVLLSLSCSDKRETSKKTTPLDSVQVVDIPDSNNLDLMMKDPAEFPKVKDLGYYKQTAFLFAPESAIPKDKNAIYCSTLGIAWSQISELLPSPYKIDNKYADLQLLDKSGGYDNSLKKGDYEAVIDVNIEQLRIETKVKFNKALPFETGFDNNPEDFIFKDNKVASFSASGGYVTYNSQIDILYYNDNNFIVKLQPKDPDHEILLYLPQQKPKTLAETFDELKQLRAKGNKERKDNWRYEMISGDYMVIPKLSFNIENEYKSMMGNEINTAVNTFYITKMKQQTAFMLDEYGAKIEGQAAAATAAAYETREDKPIPKKMLFNKPFLIILKRKDSPNPYFAMWVENTELMQK